MGGPRATAKWGSRSRRHAATLKFWGYKRVDRISNYKLYVRREATIYRKENTMSLNVNAIKTAITAGGRGSEVMRDVVMSTYKRNIQMSLANLSALDNKNLQLAIDVMMYRRQPGWSDDVFCELYVFAKEFTD